MKKDELLKNIEKYWTNRAEGYSQVNLEELAGEKRPVWLSVIEEHMPKAERKRIRILDIGTGPGFFSIILSRAGYQVTAIDYTEEMLRKAKMNAGILADKIEWYQMDAQALRFADNTFDMIVSRNVTWNLEHPDRAYAEWLRVLRPGGVLLNFDANWHAHLFDPELARLYAEDAQTLRAMGYAVEDEHGDPIMDELIPQLPLSREQRPGWDKACLERLGCRDVLVRAALPPDIMNDYYRIRYTHIPMFLVRGIKQ